MAAPLLRRLCNLVVPTQVIEHVLLSVGTNHTGDAHEDAGTEDGRPDKTRFNHNALCNSGIV